MNLLHPSGAANGEMRKVLSAPVQLGELAKEGQGESDDASSIWIKKVEDRLQVDSKKLEKAELQLQKKLDKREKNEGGKPNNAVKYKSNEATASQVLSKKDVRAESSGTNNTKDIKIENFDIAYGEFTFPAIARDNDFSFLNALIYTCRR
jgi:ATP-binding cassette subfamily F protein 3